ncbi:DNA recombination protein RmuC [Candidatus Saccharibacteria bacterium]|nr:DNA recombination protein RmuC [Candidatus Saccharibacteria bacterium]
MEILMVILLVLNLVAILFGIYYFSTRCQTKKVVTSELETKIVKTEGKIELLSKKVEELGPIISDEFRKNRKELNENFEKIQVSNEKKLEQMRETVDEKLQKSVERRFNESFTKISQQLTQVYQGLGEMKSLASGVGDLKKVMEGVKTRGVYGEVQLGSIIEDMLAPSQYLTNTLIKKGSLDRVEFAIRLPGKDAEVLLPIDSKFPIENYQRLLSAYDEGDKDKIEKARKELAKDVKTQAKKICDKYIEIPKTTAFGLMFVPTESLYAEIIRIPGLDDTIRKKYNISICGPSTLPVVLSGLLMGYRTIAIEKRSAEVWKVLESVKAQFGKFGDLLDGVERKLNESAKKIGAAKAQSKKIENTMNEVGELPEKEAEKVLRIEF